MHSLNTQFLVLWLCIRFEKLLGRYKWNTHMTQMIYRTYVCNRGIPENINLCRIHFCWYHLSSSNINGFMLFIVISRPQLKLSLKHTIMKSFQLIYSLLCYRAVMTLLKMFNIEFDLWRNDFYLRLLGISENQLANKCDYMDYFNRRQRTYIKYWCSVWFEYETWKWSRQWAHKCLIHVLEGVPRNYLLFTLWTVFIVQFCVSKEIVVEACLRIDLIIPINVLD